MIVPCPRCGKETEMTGNPYRPFCSERCQLVDLGNWVTGVYRIAGKEDEDEDGGQPPPQEEPE